MMWNPFRSVKLKPVLPVTDVKPAVGPETEDPVYRAEVERANYVPCSHGHRFP